MPIIDRVYRPIEYLPFRLITFKGFTLWGVEYPGGIWFVQQKVQKKVGSHHKFKKKLISFRSRLMNNLFKRMSTRGE